MRESEIVLYGMYLGFGVWLRKWPQPVRLSRIAGWLALVTYAWIMWQSLEKLVARGRFDVNWYVYTTVPIFVLSTSLLIWLRGWLGGMRVGEGVRRWVEQVSRMSLGFYLLQVPLMIGLGQFGVGRWLGSWWEIWPVRYVTVVGVMWVVLSGLGKVRWLGRWVY